MAGCTAFGFAVGLWMDKKFGTGFWMPLMTFVGIAAGFREMFVTLGQLNRQNQQSRRTVAKPSPSTSAPVAPQSAPRARPASEAQAQEVPRARLFKVPPPPFMEQPQDAGQQELNTAEIARRLAAIERDVPGDVRQGEEKSDAV